jgi:S-adenosylmethionine hydrolase
VPDFLITLTTDFGLESPYVAAMKGALLSVNHSVRLIDLSHQIPAQDIRYAAFFLAASVPYYPAGTLHMVVVDPGVGTDRAILYVEVAGQRLLTPDNGCLTRIFETMGPPNTLIRVQEPHFWRKVVSDTFNGRDIFAPVAGHLSLGVKPSKLGPIVKEWVTLEIPRPVTTSRGVQGEVLFVDHFGNLITNIPATMVQRRPNALTVGSRLLDRFAWVRTYGEAKMGQVALLVSSVGNLEVDIVQGDAAKRFGASVGTHVEICFAD